LVSKLLTPDSLRSLLEKLVDDQKRGIHNLVSVLQTQQRKRRVGAVAKSSQAQRTFFKNSQPISVGA
jgi:hypothetical protein